MNPSRRVVVLAWGVGVALGAVVGCKSSIDPDKGTFSCTTTADCGDGYDCVQQLAGGGFCFKPGTCVAETCNGVDDNCNGVIDDGVPETGTACTTGLLGVCSPGRYGCDGGLVCYPFSLASAERCNGLDDDCDGLVDEDFDLQNDDFSCGACGNACAQGTSCRQGHCRESACDDGVDNDSSGLADCLDPSCQGRSCGPADGGATCGGRDGGVPDAGVDGGPADAGDAGDVDAGDTDAGGVDAGDVDAGDVDGGATDGGPGLPPGCFGG